MTEFTASVVIPAHDEEAGLQRCLERLLAGTGDAKLEVVVVANGCSDRTAEVARAHADRGVRCVELAEASKIAALRAGDLVASTFPRIYLDADVVISVETAEAMAAALAEGPWLAVAPRLALDLRGTSVMARCYLRMWEALPVFRSHYVGSGCYALSATGRARFARFPDVIGDDQFVNDLFAPHEKQTLADQRLEVVPPSTLRGIVRRSLRVRAGRLDLTSSRAAPRPGGGTARFVLSALASPRRLPSVVVFTTTQVLIAVMARIRRQRGSDRAWLRDDTSRVRRTPGETS